MSHVAIAENFGSTVFPVFDGQLGPDAERLNALLKRTKLGNAADRRLIEEVLAFAATAEQRLIQQESRIAELKSISMSDELTGLLNRRGLMDNLNRTIAAARRHGEGGVVVFLDVDNLKTINDECGHDIGDAAIRHVARVLAENVRASDFVARVGGDEFVVVLVRADRKQGLVKAARLQEALASSPLHIGKKELPLGASVGASAFDGSAEAEEVLRSADLAMYRDKRNRRRGRTN